MDGLVPVLPLNLLALRVHPQPDVLLDGDPAIIDVDGRAEDVDFLKDATLISATVLPDFDGPRKMPAHGTRAPRLVYSVVGKTLIFPIRPFASLPKLEDGSVMWDLPYHCRSFPGSDWERCAI